METKKELSEKGMRQHIFSLEEEAIRLKDRNKELETELKMILNRTRDERINDR